MYASFLQLYVKLDENMLVTSAIKQSCSASLGA